MTPIFPRDRVLWLIVCMTVIGLEGCGGDSPPAPVVPVPVPNAQPMSGAPQPTGQMARNSRASNSERRKEPAKTDATPVNRLGSENSNDVFVAESPQQWTAQPAPAFAADEKFIVEFGQPQANSGHFLVAAATASSAGTARSDLQLPEGFTAVARFGYSSEGYPLRIRGKIDGKEMAFVSGGVVRVGSQSGPADTQPEFTTFLDPFYMDLTEVTVSEFEKFREHQREEKKRVPTPVLNAAGNPDFPALGVNWGDASIYAKWVQKELPTEAQFEKAARGPNAVPHPWGHGRAIWPEFREPRTISQVGHFSGDLSPFGIYDLAGNAREWCFDFYAANSHQEAAQVANRQTLMNWSGPRRAGQSGLKVVKGAGPNWEVYYRWGVSMGDRPADVGFRCVLPVKMPPSSPSESATS